jgi:hypothetical protein
VSSGRSIGFAYAATRRLLSSGLCCLSARLCVGCLGVLSGGNVLNDGRERLVVCLPVVKERQRGQLIACSNASCLAWIARCMSGGLARIIESSRDIWVMA